jgi:hypothetical protein
MTIACKKRIKPDTRIGFRLTADERKLILDLVCLDDECEEIVRDTPVGEPIWLTLDQWDDFGCYVAAKANHIQDEKLQQELDFVFAVIENILDCYTDEELLPTAFNGKECGGGLPSSSVDRSSVVAAAVARSNPSMFSEPLHAATASHDCLHQRQAALSG